MNINFCVTIELGQSTATLLTTLVREVIEAFKPKPTGTPQYRLVGGGFVHTYAEDRKPDTVPFKKPVAVDSENQPVDPQPEISYTFSSDNEDGVAVTDNGDGTVTLSYGTAIKKDDGSYTIFEIKATSNDIALPDGSTIKDVKTEQIQLVPGAIAGFLGGGFQLPDA